jgi:hypothetical protein
MPVNMTLDQISFAFSIAGIVAGVLCSWLLFR